MEWQTIDSAPDLLPCPFCGKSGEMRTEEVAYEPMHYALCINCYCAETPLRESRDDAIRDWNTRTPPKQPDDGE